jgi:hypothetical protein
VEHPASPEAWDLRPGDRISRVELHRRYKGRQQGGISPSSGSPNIMLFTSEAGHAYGYFDRMHADGCFHYTGASTTRARAKSETRNCARGTRRSQSTMRTAARFACSTTEVGEGNGALQHVEGSDQDLVRDGHGRL